MSVVGGNWPVAPHEQTPETLRAGKPPRIWRGFAGKARQANGGADSHTV
jgi:hypothetical protein